MMRRLFALSLFALWQCGTPAYAQVIYSGCTGPGCERKSCLSLDCAGPDGCIALENGHLVSTGQPCPISNTPPGEAQCALPNVANQLLMSVDTSSAVWVDMIDCPAGALAFDAATRTFSCVQVNSQAQLPPPAWAQKSSLEARNSTVLSDDLDLKVPVLCSAIPYEVTAHLLTHTDAGASASAPALQLNFALEGTGAEGLITCTSSFAGTTIFAQADMATPLPKNLTINSSGGKSVVECQGVITTGVGCASTTTNLRLQWAQNVSSAKLVYLDAGSSVVVRQLP